MVRSDSPIGSRRQKRIGINAHLLSTQAGYRRAGIHHYIAQVLSHLPDSPDAEYLVYSRQAEMLQERPGFSLKKSVWPTESRLVRILWEQTTWPLLATLDKVDLLHGMAFVTPYLSNIPAIITIYDLSFIHFPDRFPKLQRIYLHRQTERSCRNAARIITISDSTRQDVHKYFQIPMDNIDVVMPGVDSHYRQLPVEKVERFKMEQGLPGEVILHVGTLQPRKNLPVLLEAMTRLKRDGSLLVLVGGKGWHYDEIFSRIKHLGIEDKVLFTGYVEDSDLPLWYNSASVLVFPSVYEGFGMPVIEAMACGTPVIATRSSSIPEAGGDAAQYFAADDVDSLVDKLMGVLDDVGLAEEMRKKGLEQASRFSWKRAGEETAMVYRRIMTDQ